eukprot:gene5947-biopygen11369
MGRLGSGAGGGGRMLVPDTPPASTLVAGGGWIAVLRITPEAPARLRQGTWAQTALPARGADGERAVPQSRAHNSEETSASVHSQRSSRISPRPRSSLAPGLWRQSLAASMALAAELAAAVASLYGGKVAAL